MSIAKPTLSTIKKAVLGLIKSSVSKTIYRAEEILLSPCCDPQISASAVSVGADLYDVTLTFGSSPNFLQKGLILLNGTATTYDDSGAITIPNVPILGGPGTVNIPVQVFLQTNYATDHLVGVSLIKEISVVLP